MKRLPASFLIVMLGSVATHASEWQCVVELNDGTKPKLLVQADKEQAAKAAAVQRLGSRTWGSVVSVGCTRVPGTPPATQQVPQSAPPGTSRASQSEAPSQGDATTSQQGYRCREKARPSLTGLSSTGLLSETSVWANSNEEAERKAKQQRPSVSRGFSCSPSAVAAAPDQPHDKGREGK
jgi:hypothetical protein